MNIEITAIAWKWLAALVGLGSYLFFIGRRVGKVEAGLESNTKAINSLTERIDRMMLRK